MGLFLAISIRLLTILTLIASSICCVNFNNISVCYLDTTFKPFRYYGSKTTYTIARNAFYNNSFTHDLSNCKPIMLYFIGRHAIRYPDAEDIEQMSRVLPVLRKNIIKASEQGLTELCDKDLNAIINWKLRMKESDDNRVSDTGAQETKTIAKEFKQRFPSLFDAKKATLEVGVTQKKRTTETADAFLQEINFLNGDDSDYVSDSDHSDNVKSVEISERQFLYFHDICEELLLQQGVQLIKPKVVQEFRNSELMQSLIKRVNQRLGFRNENMIDSKQLKNIIRACHFEFAIYGHSPWCAALNENELKILEFLDDIEDFYEDAYGRRINSIQTCPLIGDLIDKVKLTIQKKGRKTYLHFTHAGVVKRLYSSLGLFNDLNSGIDLSMENFCLSDNRKWKSSLVTPFNANFAAVLYKCKRKDKNEDKKSSKYKILTLVQETPVVIKGCDSALCPIEQFLNNYEMMSDNCNLNEICRI